MTVSRILVPVLGLLIAGCAMTPERYFAQRAAYTCDAMAECDDDFTDRYDSKLDCQTQLEDAFTRGWELAGEPCDFDPDGASLCLDAMSTMDCDYADPESQPPECADVWICD
jgi:hypothetical protein